MVLTKDQARKAVGDPSAFVFPERAEQALRGAGLPLADLLSVTITNDPAVRVLLEYVSGHWFQDWSSIVENRGYDCSARPMLDGRFLEHQPAWPAVLERYDLFVEWCDRAGSRFAKIEPTERAGLLDHLADHNPDAYWLLGEIRSIARAVRARYEAVMSLLRSGDLEAVGHANGSGDPAPILPGLWSAPKTRMSFIEGEILQLVDVSVESTGNWPPSRVERTEVRWSDVVVRRPALLRERPHPQSEERPEKNKGGAPPKFLWEEAYERLVVKLGNDGYPSSGIKNDFAKMFVDCFQEIRKAEVPSEGTAGDWLRDNHLRVWNGAETPRKAAQRRRPAK